MYYKNPYFYKNYMVLQGGILSVLMIGRVFVLIQALSEWSAFEVDGAGV